MNILDEDLLPTGFKELIECLNEQNSNVVKAKDIYAAITQEHDFTYAKVNGIVKRAEKKELLIKIGRGIYKYNSESAKAYSLNSKDIKYSDGIKATNIEGKEKNVLTKMNDIINQAAKRIDKEIQASEMLKLSSEDFEKAKIKVDALKKLARE